VLHWKAAQDRLQAHRACGFHAVQHSGIAKSLKAADNEPKHGGVVEPFALYEGDGAEEIEKELTEGCDL
jgi:hypothetical protein